MDYDPLAESYAAHRRAHPALALRLVEVGGVGPLSRVLEIGCGTGNHVWAVAGAAGCRAWGVDPSRAMLAHARCNAPGVLWMVGVAEALPLPSARMDLAFMVDVLHHLRDPAQAFHEAHRVLRPGGAFCVATDSHAIIRGRRPLSVYFPETVPIELARYAPLDRVERWMRGAGFEETGCEEVATPFLLTDASMYRARAFSALRLIGEDAFRRGLARLEHDLRRGPVACEVRYVLLHSRRGLEAEA